MSLPRRDAAALEIATALHGLIEFGFVPLEILCLSVLSSIVYKFVLIILTITVSHTSLTANGRVPEPNIRGKLFSKNRYLSNWSAAAAATVVYSLLA